MTTPFDGSDREKVLLVDGNNILSRATYAYGARAPHADEEQQVAGSIMLWLNSLRRYVRAERPDRVAVCFDPPMRPSWRAEVCATYKADRISEGVAAPVLYAVVLAHTLGLETREHSQAEADDLIAGLAKVHADLGHDVVIVSADKDLLQCLGPRVSVRRPGVQPEWWNAAEVEKRYGVPPRLMAAYQALVGDTGDGVPGVRGIGKKRALGIFEDLGILADPRASDVLSHPQMTEERQKMYEDALAVVTLPGSPDRYKEALDPVPGLVGFRAAQGVTAHGVLTSLGLGDEAELVQSGTFWE